MYEAPTALLARLKLGREEFCQRLLTSLILGGPYPKWNTRSTPSAKGTAFLRALHGRCFGGPWPGDELDFVDELELPPRHDAEPGGWPDYGVLWSDRVWLIELKTEKASHRHGQIPGYFELAHHHHPESTVDFLYLTPPMSVDHVVDRPDEQFAHLAWGDLVELLRTTWPAGDDADRDAVVDGLIEAIENLDLPPRIWRERTYPTAASLPEEEAAAPTVVIADVELPRDRLDAAIALAEATAEDGKQRALDRRPRDLGDLMALRVLIRDRLAASPAGSPLRRVVPWIWRPQSSGRPLTPAGEEVGMELRFSRYQRPQY